MKIFGLAGWSGSGKTTLMVQLIPDLIGRGLRVSTIKHAHHLFDVDQPGKDSHRHRTAGAQEVLITSAHRWVLMHENRADPEPPLAALLARLSPVDLVLIEGFKREAHPKLEIWRPETGKPLLAPDDPTMVAVATPRAAALPALSCPRLDLDNVPEIADFICAHTGLVAGGIAR